MVLSYSAAAQPSADTPSTISLVTPPVAASPVATASTSTSTPDAGPSKSSSSSGPGIHHLILDAGPLLSLAPLRHLAQTFHTTPMVLAELRDPKAREHWERLGLSGVNVKVEPPSAEAMRQVIAFAKKTGDFAVLSQTDLSVIALTYQYELQENGLKNIRTEPGQKKVASPKAPVPDSSTATEQANAESGQNDPSPNQEEEDEEAESESESDPESVGEDEDDDESDGVEDAEAVEATNDEVEEASQSIEQVLLDEKPSTTALPTPTLPEQPTAPALSTENSSKQDDAGPDEEDDESEGGEWITPSNVSKHRSHDLGLLPTGSGAGNESEPIAAACMTGDFAVQNVLLGMGLGLVGEGGKRIGKVKSFVLRCHACFKICKDSSKRFCPSCGNPSLLRTTVTVSAKTGEQQIHLKKNFQYHLRGSKYSIPDAKPGRAKGQLKGGSGLVLREDQAEWQNAVRSQDIRRRKEEKRAAKGALEGWNDPDWLPEIITVGMSGKGRSGGHDMPRIGHGRKNPNQARKKR